MSFFWGFKTDHCTGEKEVRIEKIDQRELVMASKHKKASAFVKSGLYKGLSEFQKLERRITALPEGERGDAFEIFTEACFATQAIYQASEVWPGTEIPGSVRELLGLPLGDKGIDGVFLTKKGDYHAYQAKFRSNRSALSWGGKSGLSTFMGLSDKADSRVLLTNSMTIPRHMEKRTDFYAVMGHDLDDLENRDFQAIEDWLSGVETTAVRKEPYLHQKEALKNLLSGLNVYDRSTSLMACGTGKTLVGLWSCERFGAETILVLVPSLDLMRQVLREYVKETSWDDYTFMCVCSDSSVAKGVDGVVLKQSELNFSVSTKSEDVSRYFNNAKSRVKLVFSTYDSAHVVAEGMPEGFTFDVGIFDEAHKTAGRSGTKFTFALRDENLSIRKRLFFTATPRHFDIEKRDKHGNRRVVYSMDDEEVYGPVTHKLTFFEAAERKIISGYKVLVSTVTSEMVSREMLRLAEIVVGGVNVCAHQVARAIALKAAVEQVGARRIFTFHNKVNSAKSFTSCSAEGVSIHMENFESFHVNGKMRASQRESIMREFEEAPNAIMSNARVLTEGVDVPAVDMVAFMSPKKSNVDIVQATGRALRKVDGKDFGYILLPVFVEVAAGEDDYEAVERTDFSEVWNVLHALQEQDEILAEVIRQMREDRGRKRGYDDSRLRERVEVIGPECSLRTLRDVITAKIIDNLGSTWDERFGELLKYKDEYGHCNVPMGFIENPVLSRWVRTQRGNYTQKKLYEKRVRKLEEVGFLWKPDEAAWYENFQQLLQFHKLNGHFSVSSVDPEMKSLCQWVDHQVLEYKKDELSDQKIKILEEIGFVWLNKHEKVWEEKYQELCQFHADNGHSNVPADYSDNEELGKWVTKQRASHKKGKIIDERFERLDKLGFIWDGNAAAWDERCQSLHDFFNINGHCRVNRNDFPEISTWLTVQRKKYADEALSMDQVRKLNELGIIWDIKEELWEEMFTMLCDFKAEVGNCNVPRGYLKNPTLGTWLKTQRKNHVKGTLREDRVSRLEEVGISWDQIKDFWEEMYLALCEFKNENGHCFVPRNFLGNTKLSRWLNNQRERCKKGTITDEQLERLKVVGFGQYSKDAVWEERFQELCDFAKEKGHCNVPQSHLENPPLGTWVGNMRHRKKRLSPEQLSRLEEIGFVWNSVIATWEKQFAEVLKYKEENGHCDVPDTRGENGKLGAWVASQRCRYKEGVISSEKIGRLEGIGFRWRIKDIA